MPKYADHLLTSPPPRSSNPCQAERDPAPCALCPRPLMLQHGMLSPVPIIWTVIIFLLNFSHMSSILGNDFTRLRRGRRSSWRYLLSNFSESDKYQQTCSHGGFYTSGPSAHRQILCWCVFLQIGTSVTNKDDTIDNYPRGHQSAGGNFNGFGLVRTFCFVHCPLKSS